MAGLPTANFLSKADLLEPEVLEKILEWGERLDVLEADLYEESANRLQADIATGQRVEFAIAQLRTMQDASIIPGLIPLSSEHEEGLADVLTFVQGIYGGMADMRDGFAADLDEERN